MSTSSQQLINNSAFFFIGLLAININVSFEPNNNLNYYRLNDYIVTKPQC